jgi:hypothetical protein
MHLRTVLLYKAGSSMSIAREADFTAVSKDGTGSHTHQQISNFKSIRTDSSNAPADNANSTIHSNLLTQGGNASHTTHIFSPDAARGHHQDLQLSIHVLVRPVLLELRLLILLL